jgi:hypothetical protein
VCARGAHPAWSSGPSTSPLEDMTERLSRFLVALEALLLAVPVTALATLAGIAGLLLLTDRPMPIYERAQTIVYLVPFVPLVAGWILMARFVVFGSAALRSSSKALWFAASLGAALFVLAALCAAAWTRSITFLKPDSVWYWLLSYFRELAFGLPALVPLAHLALERRFRSEHVL